MLFSNKHIGFIYLEKNAFYYYSNINPNNLLRFDFPPDCVIDMDLVNKEKFQSDIQSFIDNNKILPVRLAIIFSPEILFEKDFAEMPAEDLENAIQKFLDNVPFENLNTKKFSFGKNIRIVAINKTFYETIKHVLEKKGFITDTIAPYSSLRFKTNIPSNIDIQTARLILKKYDSLRQENLSMNENILSLNSEAKANKNSWLANPEKKKTVILVSVFILLLLILIFMLFKYVFSVPKPVKRSVSSPPAVKTVPPVPTPQILEKEKTSTPSAVIQKEIEINILNSSGIAGQAENLKKDLNLIGFKNIKTGNTQTTGKQKTLIIFSPVVNEETKNLILKEIQKTYTDFLTQENKNSQFDVTIVIGKAGE